MKITVIDQAAIDLIHARAKLFLYDQRHRRGNAGWFTIADIAADFAERPPIVLLILALKDLATSGRVEGHYQGAMRHA